jgi:hypothetical protein
VFGLFVVLSVLVIANAISKLASARRHLRASYAVAAPSTTGGRIGFILSEDGPGHPRQLTAKATAATLLWARVVSWASYALGDRKIASRSVAGRHGPPCTKRLRK